MKKEAVSGWRLAVSQSEIVKAVDVTRIGHLIPMTLLNYPLTANR
jgi:hypothetical protein